MSAAQRFLGSLARTRAGGLLRSVVNVAIGQEHRVVTIRTGVARGARLELDLGREKAYWLGHYEPAVQALLAEYVAPGDVVYDIGAHVGFMTVCAGRLGASVYAFEPSAANAARVRANAKLNDLDVEVIEAAVWDDEDGVQLVEGGSTSEGRVRAGSGLASVTIDGFARTHPGPTFLKIDAEGAELQVLRGAAETLRTHRPVIICELHAPADLQELLPGYRIERVADGSRVLAVPADA